MINPPDFDSSNFTILVVDDTEANRTIVSTFLMNNGFKVMLAENGRLALQSIQTQLPDLILLDVMMPEMNGFDMCRQLKTNEATREIPVIFMTALAATDDKLTGFNAGAVDYITRPVNQRELLARITTHLKNKVLTETFKQQALFMQTMNEIGRALTSTLNLRKVLTLILHELKDLVPYDQGAILIHQNELLEFVAARGFSSDTDLLLSTIPLLKEGDDLFYQVFRTKRPLSITTPHDSPTWPHLLSLPTTAVWLGLPLIHQDQVIGILSLTRTTTAPFTPTDIELATAFASQAVLALQNARLYDQLSKFNNKLEKEVEKRTKDLQSAYTRLEQLDQTKSDFIYVASHELFTPIALINGYCHILLSDPNLATSPSQNKIIEGINKGAKRLNEVVENILDVAKIDSKELHLFPQDLSLYPIFHQIQQSLTSTLSARNINLLIHPSIQKLGTIEADPEALPKAFSQLILNAIKFTPDGGDIMINGRFPHPHTIEITVQDTGIGIDPKNQELVFTKFYQTGKVNLHSTGRSKFKGGGPGLGLAIVKGIVEAHHGKIWVESPGYDEEACPGSQFIVQLPRKQPQN